MGKCCAVYGCLSSINDKTKRNFYSFPSDASRCRQWIRAAGRIDLESKNIKTLHNSYRICDLHFVSSDHFKRNLKHNAVPSLNLPQLENDDKLSKYTQTDVESKSCALYIEINTPSTSKDNSFGTQTVQGLYYNTPRIQLSAPPPPQQQQQFVDEQPGPSGASSENENDSDFDIDEREVGVITEQQTGLEDPLANNSDHQCRFCAKNANNSIKPTDKPYSKNNTILLILNDIHVELDLDYTHKVCLDCDRKLLDMFYFVRMVKNAQDELINASFDEETETLIVKTECVSPTPDTNDEMNKAKEEIVHSITIDEMVVKDVLTHKKRKCNKDTKRTTKRQKKLNVEDIKVTSEDTVLIMEIKEETTEKDNDANTQKCADSEERDTGPDDKPSELDIATNALLNEMAEDGFS